MPKKVKNGNGKKQARSNKGGKKAGGGPPRLPRAMPVAAPAAQSKVIRGMGKPKITHIGNGGDTLVVHREFISDLIGSATANAFKIFGLPINPGNSLMFPWLSDLARDFESYVFKSLKFLFETDAPTSTPGTVLLAVDYDPSDALPASKREMMSFEDATRGPAWCSNVLTNSRENLSKRETYFVASDALGNQIISDSARGGSADTFRFEDVGELLIASSNAPVSAQLGEMYVEYEVQLMTPVSDVEGHTDLTTMRCENNTAGTNTIAADSDSLWGDQDSWNWVTGDDARFLFAGVPVRYSASSGVGQIQFLQSGTYFISVVLKDFSCTTGSTPNFSVVPGTGNILTDIKLQDTTVKVGAANLASVAYDAYLDVHAPGTNSSVDGAYVYGAIGFTLTGTAGLGFTAGAYAAAIRAFLVPEWDSAGGELGNVQGRPRRRRQRVRLSECTASRISLLPSKTSMAGSASSNDKEKEPPSPSEKERRSECPGQVQPADIVPLERTTRRYESGLASGR